MASAPVEKRPPLGAPQQAYQGIYNAIEQDHYDTEIIQGAYVDKPAPSEYRPDGARREVPIGNYNDVNGYLFTKWERGFLAGHGGNEVETGLGSTVLPILPSGYNNHWLNDVCAASGYASGQPLLSNWDQCDPLNAWGPAQLARAEFIPTTWSSIRGGLDPVTGVVAPRVFPQVDQITGAPTPQFNQNAQVAIGGGSYLPSVPFGQRVGGSSSRIAQNTMYAQRVKDLVGGVGASFAPRATGT